MASSDVFLILRFSTPGIDFGGFRAESTCEELQRGERSDVKITFYYSGAHVSEFGRHDNKVAGSFPKFDGSFYYYYRDTHLKIVNTRFLCKYERFRTKGCLNMWGMKLGCA